MRRNLPKMAHLPVEIRSDPVVQWAETIARDERYRAEAMYDPFEKLKDRYFALLKRFLKIARISDSYQLTLKEVNALLDSAARKDYLTGLSNRREILEKIDSEISRAKRHGTVFSILVVDIDHFKRLNDTYGHEAGDLVLKTVADCLRRILRLEDHCARWGGEEFLICLPETNLQNAMGVAEKLRSNVERTSIEYEDTPIQVTITLGVSIHEGSRPIHEVIKAADIAMYGAKSAGRNRVGKLP
jgi:diguanylate cyclase (GGDEF)-like protein